MDTSMSIEADAVGFAAAPRGEAWKHATGVLSLSHPRVMGIVNLTPDSFYDGGVLVAEGTDTPNVSVAVRRARQLVAEGADVLDIGGESTRPGSDPVSDARQLRRVLPVIERLAAGADAVTVPISIDTRSAEVAERALAAGASIVNDVSGVADPEMASVVASANAGLVIGHLRGEPRTMQQQVSFANMLGEVTDELGATVRRVFGAGVGTEHIVVDPGIGFGKTAEQSAALVAAAGWLREATGCPVMIGASRKSFLTAIIGETPPDRARPRPTMDTRLVGSLAAAIIAVERGANVIRAHDVAQTVQALAVARSVRKAWDEYAVRATDDRGGRQ